MHTDFSSNFVKLFLEVVMNTSEYFKTKNDIDRVLNYDLIYNRPSH